MSRCKTLMFDPEELARLGEFMSYSQIADMYNCSTTTVRKQFIDMEINKCDLRNNAIFVPVAGE